VTKRDPLHRISIHQLRIHERKSRLENRYTEPSNCGSCLNASLALEIKSDLCVDAVVCDFALVHFGGEFLDVNRANGAVPARRLRYPRDNPLVDLVPEPAAIRDVWENKLALVKGERAGSVVATER